MPAAFWTLGYLLLPQHADTKAEVLGSISPLEHGDAVSLSNGNLKGSTHKEGVEGGSDPLLKVQNTAHLCLPTGALQCGPQPRNCTPLLGCCC